MAPRENRNVSDGGGHSTFRRRKYLVDSRMQLASTVKVAGIVEDPVPFKQKYDPHHPDADAKGYVTVPNINLMEEMVNMTAVAVIDAQEREKRRMAKAQSK